MIAQLTELAGSGCSVSLPDALDNLARAGGEELTLSIERTDGGFSSLRVVLPQPENRQEEQFLEEVVFAAAYNLISALGGRRMILGGRACAVWRGRLSEAFGVQLPKAHRAGYAKCLNVTDRINAALGLPPFRFDTGERPSDTPLTANVGDPAAIFRSAAQRAMTGAYLGLDVGGSDIKCVAVRDGVIAAVKEYDWNPMEARSAAGILGPILLLARLMRALTFSPMEESTRRELLSRDCTDERMAELLPDEGALPPFDAVGVNYPDVVIEDRIVGGETTKTRGMREHAADFEAELLALSNLASLLHRHCREGGRVRIANDGSLAAYTAAVELAHASGADRVRDGVIAHTLGTELGTGWIDESGRIPPVPLEIYNCVADLGNHPARRYPPDDVRSILNFNTGIPGTLQRCCSQWGAYRLAAEIFPREAPDLYRSLFERGFLAERSGVLSVVTGPDMRKPFLQYLMEKAASGHPAAGKIFEKTGESLLVTARLMRDMLHPRADSRVLLGRFVKEPACFALMQRGCAGMPLLDGGASLSHTPLMKQLASLGGGVTVGQFGQAVGAICYALANE